MVDERPACPPDPLVSSDVTQLVWNYSPPVDARLSRHVTRSRALQGDARGGAGWAPRQGGGEGHLQPLTGIHRPAP
jgi:hypothetical protein